MAEHKQDIELFYLPSYSTQLNLEERLNADLKQEMGKCLPVRSKAKLRDAANEHRRCSSAPRARYRLFPRSACPLCRLILHRAGSISTGSSLTSALF